MAGEQDKQAPQRSIISAHIDKDGNHYLQAAMRTQSVDKNVTEAARNLILTREAPMLLTQLCMVAAKEVQDILVQAIELEAAQAKPKIEQEPGPKLEEKQ